MDSLDYEMLMQYVPNFVKAHVLYKKEGSITGLLLFGGIFSATQLKDILVCVDLELLAHKRNQFAKQQLY